MDAWNLRDITNQSSLIFIWYCYLFMFLYFYTENHNSCITRKPVHFTCGPAVAGQCQSNIGPRRSASDRSRIGSGALRHARMGIKNKSNDNKTTLVAILMLVLGGGICTSGKLTWSNIFWGPRVVVVPTLSSPVASQVVKMTASNAAGTWRHGGIVAALCFPVYTFSPGNALHFLPQNTGQSITKFRWSIWSYSSLTIDDGGSSIWRLDCRWWHRVLSL